MKSKLILFIALAVVFASCNTTKKSDSQKKITMAYVDGWAEGVAMTHVTQEFFKSKGYSVDVKKAAVDLVFASLSNGDTDVFMDTWLPVTHKEKVAKFEGKIESLGVNYTNARIGLVVPEYVEINSIEELNANADKFDGKIIGIEKGAGITAKTDLAVQEYGLTLDHINSSSVAMLTELSKAYKANKWIVVAGWAPHWKFGRMNLKFLDDSKGVYGSTERIETYARKGFKESDPFAAKYFANFKLDNAQMSELLAKMEEGKDKEAIAKQWIADNADFFEGLVK
nr:glycine betaine ABC transporter substrate-binding protein [uncultured Carboxylicivirga sp.]